MYYIPEGYTGHSLKKSPRKSNICAVGGIGPQGRIWLESLDLPKGLEGDQGIPRVEPWDSSDPGLLRPSTRFIIFQRDILLPVWTNLRERVTSAPLETLGPKGRPGWDHWTPKRGSTGAYSIPQGVKASPERSHGIPVILNCSARAPVLLYSRGIYCCQFGQIFEKE